ncbi:MAG: DUF1565 domain-containing protein, partial [Nitrospinae bacterium]|nr:DUF1565 domain-containing protein [Nitrospinota bacterium]
MGNIKIVGFGENVPDEITPDYDDLTQALAESEAGDIIVLLEGTYIVNNLSVPVGVSLIGVDPQKVIIQGANADGVNTLVARGDNLIAGLTVSGGGPIRDFTRGPFGPTTGTYNITRSIGSGIYVIGSNVRITDNIITDNLGYGIRVVANETIIEDNFIYGNGSELPDEPVWPYAA